MKLPIFTRKAAQKAEDEKLIGEIQVRLTEVKKSLSPPSSDAKASVEKDQATEVVEQRKIAEDKMASLKFDTSSSVSYIQCQLDAATASNAEMDTIPTKERAEAREAAMIKSQGDRRSADGAHRAAGRAASRQ